MPGSVRSIQGYRKLAETAAGAVGRKGVSAALDAERSIAAATAIFKQGGAGAAGGAGFTVLQYGFDAARYALADRIASEL